MAKYPLELIKLNNEKRDVVSKFIKLKDENQKMYFRLQETLNENEQLKLKLAEVIQEKDELEKCLTEPKVGLESKDSNQSLIRENEMMEAKIKQLQRSSVTILKKETEEQQDEYEVESLLKHRGNKFKGKREFLVRWKNYTSSHDCWQNERDLHCPDILEQYLNDNKL